MNDILELFVDNMCTFRAFKLYILTKHSSGQYEHLIRYEHLMDDATIRSEGTVKVFGKTAGSIILLSWLIRLFEFDWRSNELYLESNE